jgi:predicted O-methyltransferase YrrM
MKVISVSNMLKTASKYPANRRQVAGSVLTCASLVMTGFVLRQQKHSRLRDPIGSLLIASGVFGLAQVSNGIAAVVREESLRREIYAAYRQAEHYAKLTATVVNAPESLRGWAISPDACRLLADIIEETRPKLIVELGSGASTVLMAELLAVHCPQSRIVSIDHNPEFAAKTQRELDHRGLANAKVRVAPLVPMQKGPFEGSVWYPVTAFEDLQDIDLLFIDGPVARPGSLTRMPSVALSTRLSPRATVAIDDALRRDEAAMAKAWGRILQSPVDNLRAEKGFALITKVESIDFSGGASSA